MIALKVLSVDLHFRGTDRILLGRFDIRLTDVTVRSFRVTAPSVLKPKYFSSSAHIEPRGVSWGFFATTTVRHTSDPVPHTNHSAAKKNPLAADLAALWGTRMSFDKSYWSLHWNIVLVLLVYLRRQVEDGATSSAKRNTSSILADSIGSSSP